MERKEKERRKHPRISARFMVSYRIMTKDEEIDLTQTKDLGMGGMLLTTNRKFEPGTQLSIEIRIPSDPNPIKLVGKVIDSRKVVEGVIYDTRLEFLSVDAKHYQSIQKTVEHYLKKG